MRALIHGAVGDAHFATALELMGAGKLDGDLGATVHDFLADEIRNEATAIWTGVIRQPHDNYPVTVNGFHGVYWVWAMEYDPVGYFMNKRTAIDFARSHWGRAEIG